MATNIWLGNSIGNFKSVQVTPGPNVQPTTTFTIGLASALFTFTGWNATTIVTAWNASSNTAISAITALVSGTSVIFTSTVQGADFEISCSIPANIKTSSTYQLLTVTPAPTGGSFTITVNGQTTAAISFNSTAATFASNMQTAIAALLGFGSTDVLVTAQATGTFLFDFSQGQFSGANVPTLSATHTGFTGGGNAGVSVTVLQAGAAAGSGINETVSLSFPAYGTHTVSTNSVQQIASSSMAGTFTITITGYGTTVAIPFSAGKTTIRTALEAIVGKGNVAVTGGPLYYAPTKQYYPVVCTFQGTLAGVAVPTMTANVTGSSVNEVQQLAMLGTPSAGTFTITYSSQTTSAIAYNATAPVVQAALAALSNIGAGNIFCTGGRLGPASGVYNPLSYGGLDVLIQSVGATQTQDYTHLGTSSTSNGTVMVPVATTVNSISAVQEELFFLTGITQKLTQVKLVLFNTYTPTGVTFSGSNYAGVGDTGSLGSGSGLFNVYVALAGDNVTIPTSTGTYSALSWSAATDAVTVTRVATSLANGVVPPHASWASYLGYTYTLDLTTIVNNLAATLTFPGGTSNLLIRISAKAGVTTTGSVSGAFYVAGTSNPSLNVNVSQQWYTASAQGPVGPTLVITQAGDIINPVTLNFTGTLANSSLSLCTVTNSVTGGTPSITRLTAGGSGGYTVTVPAAGGTVSVNNIVGGTFNLSIAGTVVSNIPWNATAGQVAAAINTAFGSVVCQVSGGPAPATALVITFVGSLGAQPLVPVFSSNLQTTLGGSITQTLVTAGVSPVAAANVWNLTVVPGGGTLGVSPTATITLSVSDLLPHASYTGTAIPTVGASQLLISTLQPHIVEAAINEMLGGDACRVSQTGHSQETGYINETSGASSVFWYMKDTYQIVFINQWAPQGAVSLTAAFTTANNTAATLMTYTPGTTTGDTAFFVTTDTLDQMPEANRVALGFVMYDTTATPLIACTAATATIAPDNNMAWRFKLLSQSSVNPNHSGYASIPGEGQIQFSWCTRQISDTGVITYTPVQTSTAIDWDSPATVIQTTLSQMFFGTGNIYVTGTLRTSWVSESLVDAPTGIGYNDLRVYLSGVFFNMPLDEYGYTLTCSMVNQPYVPAATSAFQRNFAVYGDFISRTLPPYTNRREKVSILNPTQASSMTLGVCSLLTTVASPATATGAAIQTALDSLFSGYTSQTTGFIPPKFTHPIFVYGTTFTDGPMEFEFTGGGGQQNPNVALLVATQATGILLGQISEAQPGSTGAVSQDAIQLVQITGAPYAGTFTLTFGGNTTSALAYNTTLSALQTAVTTANFSSPTITGDPTNGFTFDWAGSGGSRAAITATPSLNNAGVLTGFTVLTQGGLSSSFSIVELVRGRGPSYIDDLNNWSLNRVPNTGDSLVFDDSPSPASYGLDMSSVISVQTLSSQAGTIFAHSRNRQVFDVGQTVVLTGTGSAPSGLTLGSTYIVANAGTPNANNFTLTSTSGAPITVTTVGTGTLTLAVSNLTLTTYSRFAGAQIGLPHVRSALMTEYLAQYLRGGFTSIVIGLDSGAGLSLGMFDTMLGATTISVHDSDRSTVTNLPALLFNVNNSSASLWIGAGQVGLNMYANQTGVIGAVTIETGTLAAANTTIGSLTAETGTTVTLLNCTSGGTLTIG